MTNSSEKFYESMLVFLSREPYWWLFDWWVSQRRHFSSFPVSSKNQSKTAVLICKKKGEKGRKECWKKKRQLFDFYFHCSRPGGQLLPENQSAFFRFHFFLDILHPLLIYVLQLDMCNVTVCKYFLEKVWNDCRDCIVI